jgi:hypothetical protein
VRRYGDRGGCGIFGHDGVVACVVGCVGVEFCEVSVVADVVDLCGACVVFCAECVVECGVVCVECGGVYWECVYQYFDM